MIRANLLPHANETVGAFGLEFDADYLRQALLGLVVVIAVALLGLGIERMRLARLGAAIELSGFELARHAPERGETKRLALDVARYREFEREAEASRRTGADAALATARIGNGVPVRVWLDGLERDAHGYQVTGEATTFEALGRTILSLGRALPNANASLVTIDHRDAGDTAAHFSARLDMAAAAVR